MNFSMDLSKIPFCRPMSRLQLTLDKAAGKLFLGVTPDGESPERLKLVTLTPVCGGEKPPFTCTAEGGKVRIEAEKGFLELTIALPNKLLLFGKGLSLLVESGGGGTMLMGGGSAVEDYFIPGGALFTTNKVRLRFVPRKGTVKVASAWDLEAMRDPNPQIYLRPDGEGVLDSLIYEHEYDVPNPDRGETVEETARELTAEFEAFLDAIRLPGRDTLSLRAAYAVWTALQPDREMCEKRMTAPEYIEGRMAAGTALLRDNVLLALLFKDPAAAAARMGSFLKYLRPNGLLPKTANNRLFLMEAELPLFGLVLPKLLREGLSADEALFDGLHKAFSWWYDERYCQERGLFYYLHRYEPGCSPKLPFADTPPEFAPDLNALMLLWAESLAQLGETLGRAKEAAALRAVYERTLASLVRLLWDGEKFIFRNILDEPVCAGHPRALLPALLGDRLDKAVLDRVLDAIPAEATEDAVFLAQALKGRRPEKLAALAENVRRSAETLAFMTVRQALTVLLVCGAAL